VNPGRLVQPLALIKGRPRVQRSASVSARRCFGLRLAIVGAIFAGSIPRSDAQVIAVRKDVVVPPWNALQVFEPSQLRPLVDPDFADPIEPSDTPVSTRSYPEYEPVGIRNGSWMFSPTLTGGGFFDSNVFSTNTGMQGDVAGQIGGGLRAHTLWERHGIDIQATTLNTSYSHFNTLDQTDVSLKGNAHYDFDNSTTFLTGFQAAFLHEGVGSLNSPTGAIQPTPYSLFSVDGTFRKEFGRATASVGTRVDSYNYGSVLAANGTTINQSSRDGQVYKTHGRVDYSFSEKSSVFTAVEGNWRNLQGTPAQPLSAQAFTQGVSSQGYRVMGGFDVELTHLITGEIAGGYMAQHFFSSSIGNIEGPTYRAMLTWSPTRLIDVHFNAEQVVTESSDTTSTGIRASAVQLGFDYEFRRNIIFSAATTYERDSFYGEPPRLDYVYDADVRLKYLLSNITSLTLYYHFIRRDSSIPIDSFDKHMVGINASARF
jgi:hypothetical protein